jgi:hypothetical protein
MTQQARLPACIITACARKFVCAAGHVKPRRLLNFCTAECMLPDAAV